VFQREFEGKTLYGDIEISLTPPKRRSGLSNSVPTAEEVTSIPATRSPTLMSGSRKFTPVAPPPKPASRRRSAAETGQYRGTEQPGRQRDYPYPHTALGDIRLNSRISMSRRRRRSGKSGRNNPDAFPCLSSEGISSFEFSDKV